MWQTILEHSQSITGVSNILMVVIWLLYLHVFLLQFRRQKRPFLVIHHAHGFSPSADCLLVNMSQEPLHVQCILARIVTKQGEYLRQVSDFQQRASDDERGGEREVRQLREGPLQPGRYSVLGNFETILLDGITEPAASGVSPAGPDDPQRPADGASRSSISSDRAEPDADDAATNPPSDLSQVESLELCAAAVHGPSKHPIGARRRFLVESDAGQLLIRPQNIHTEQLTTFRKRREVRDWVEECLNPKHRGASQTQRSEQSSE